MNEEEKNNESAEAPEGEAPEAAAAAESPDSSRQEGDAAAEEAPAEEPVAEEEPAAQEPAAEEPAGDAEEPAGDEEPAEAPSPTERRKLERSTHTGEVGPQRSPEERAQERAERRRRRAARRRAGRARARERRRGQPRGEPSPPAAEGTGKPKLRQGVVVSDGADKTITVRIESQRSHRMYGKVIRTSSTLHAHDERNEANVGDRVRVVESRPLSRTKRWRLVEVLERAR
jgi:small subunit ribosomal protein S17